MPNISNLDVFLILIAQNVLECPKTPFTRSVLTCILQKYSKIFSETTWPIKAKFYMKHLWEGEIDVFINNPGHMTKMATMPIYGKNPSKFFFSGTTRPISTKLGMKHWGLEYYNVFINYDLWMTLTYFTARST